MGPISPTAAWLRNQDSLWNNYAISGGKAGPRIALTGDDGVVYPYKYRKTMTPYDEFATDYHWLYSDSILNGELLIEENNDVLSVTKQDAVILDCSCGIGTFPIALANRGFKVTGSDASDGMIQQAISAAATAGLNIPMICSTWEELPNHFAARFDVVFCVGNSICHCRNRDEMLRSLKGMRRVLTKGGRLVIQSRNWEYILQKKERIANFQWRERAGQRCLPIYIWNYPDSFDAEHTIDIILVFDTDGQASIRSYVISYYPFRFEQLLECLKSAGFAESHSDFDKNTAHYRVIAW